MIDRYIYAVTKELPEKTRKEIDSELRVLIEDMIDEMDDEHSYEEKIDKVLRKLGDPKEFANRYRGKERYLIGPKYFDNYIFVMKIVTLSILIGISVAYSLSVIFSIESIGRMIGGYIGTLFFSILQGAAWVTGIFAIFEYKDIAVQTGMEKSIWEPAQLPDLPMKKALISRGESIFSIIINTVFLPLFFIPEIIGIYYNINSEWGFVPFFNAENITNFRLIIFIVFSFNILIELIKIIKGRWTMKIAVITTILNIISSGLFIYLINKRDVWNTEINRLLETYLSISLERVIMLTSAVIIIITILEVGSAIYKANKYGEKR